MLDTIAAAGVDDCHVAVAVTFWEVPSDSVAVAVNWFVCGIAVRDIVPLMAIEDSVSIVAAGAGVVGEGADDPPHAAVRRSAERKALLSIAPLDSVARTCASTRGRAAVPIFIRPLGG